MMKMRRKEREKDAVFALEVLRDCEYATLATVNGDGMPYCVPLSPVVIDNLIYFHCAVEGKKLDNIKNNNAVCISGVRYAKYSLERMTVEYESAVASGTCEIVIDEAEKIIVLKAICEKYAKGSAENFDAMIARSLAKVCVCRVEIGQITGKANIA